MSDLSLWLELLWCLLIGTVIGDSFRAIETKFLLVNKKLKEYILCTQT